MSTPTGWECPKCGTVHAPSVTSCSCTARTPSHPNFPPRIDIPDDCAIKRIEVTCEDPNYARASWFPHYPYPAWSKGGAQ